MRRFLRLLKRRRIVKSIFLIVNRGRQFEAISDITKGHTNGDTTLGTRLRHQTVELLIVVAVESRTGLEPLRHAIGVDTVANNLIGTESYQLTRFIEETESITISKTRHTRHVETVMTDFFYHADKSTHRLRGIHRGDIRYSAMQEISGIATIEGAVQIGRKSIATYALRTTAIQVRMTSD